MKKLLIIILIVFFTVSILTIMFTFQAGSTFINFTGDDGDNGDDNIRPTNPSIIHDNCVDMNEDLQIYSEKQNNQVNRYKISNSNASTFREEKISIGDKLKSTQFVLHRYRNICLFPLLAFCNLDKI